MWYIWVLIAVIFIILLIMFISMQIALSIVNPKKRNLEKTRKIENDRNLGLMEFYDEKLHDECNIQSRYGYKLRLYFFIKDENSKKFIVMAHGHTYTHHGCVKYAKMMYEHGYNVVLYDERYHGNSGGNNTTLGYYEKDDLYDIITHVTNRFGKDIFIGTYGESMGAATAILEQAFDERVKFVISDCGFSSLSVLLQELLGKSKILTRFPFLKLIDFFVKVLAKFSIYQVNPIEALNKRNIPILFVHGETDRFINYHHSKDMYEAYKGPKMYMLANNNAGHAESYPQNVEEYESKVAEFLKKYIDKEQKDS